MIQISSKVIFSFITFCKQKGLDFPIEEVAREIFPYPFESLQESDLWLRASRTEKFLKIFDQYFLKENIPGMMRQVAYHSAELKSWGALSQVLMLMKDRSSFYQKPEKFLAYFLNPTTSLVDFKKSEESVEFIFPISKTKYPYLTRYFQFILESLPLFIGKQANYMTWDEDDKVTISWSDTQFELFNLPKSASSHYLKNELLEKEEILEKQAQEISLLKQALKPFDSNESSSMNHEQFFQFFQEMKDSQAKYSDYLLRLEQLIRLFNKDGSLDQDDFTEALKKLGLDRVSQARKQIDNQFTSSSHYFEKIFNKKDNHVSNKNS